MSKRKLVLDEGEGIVLIQVGAEGCDPIPKTITGTLEDAVAQLPQFLTEAQEKWTGAPRNPAYSPPRTPRKAPAAAAAPAAAPQTAEDLPLLAGQEQPASEAVVTTEATTEAEPETAAQPAAEETPSVGEGQTPAPDLATAPSEPETVVPAIAPTPDQAPEAAPVEETTAPEPATEPEQPADTAPISARIAEAPAPPQADAAGLGGWEYYLQDGRGPYADIQKAMDAMGMDKEERPHHNRWDRLSTSLKNQIPRRAKA